MTENRNEGIGRSAFEASLAQVYITVYSRVSARFGDPQLAEEVSVDSLAQAFEKWRADPAYFRTHDLTAWSSRLASWRALDRLRERTRLRPLPEEHPVEGEESPAAGPMVSRRENAGEDRVRDWELTWKCIQKLDPEDRVILSRYYYDGWTDQQVGAELFGPSASPQANGLKVWRRRQRAHARLRELLLAGGIDPGDWSAPGGQAV
jgi:DNA-directed RNA polymerase specialized sigma24 family protein